MSAKYLLSPLSAKIKELTVPYNKANIHTLSPWGSFLFSVFSLSCQAPGIYPHPSMSPNIVTILFNFLQFHSFGPKSFLLCSWIYSIKKKKNNFLFLLLWGIMFYLLPSPYGEYISPLLLAPGVPCLWEWKTLFSSSYLHLRPFSLDTSFSSLCFCFVSHKCDKLCRKLRLLQEKCNVHSVKAMRKDRCENHFS